MLLLVRQAHPPRLPVEQRTAEQVEARSNNKSEEIEKVEM
jgi:hypothetical protein